MLIWLEFGRIWNIHEIFKKHQKNANPVHMFLFCHVLTTPTDRQGLDIIKQEMLQYGVKSHISNYELSCAKRGGLGFATWNLQKTHQSFILDWLRRIQSWFFIFMFETCLNVGQT